ncbi:ABC transporter ATP-binding protein [Sulfidibacter corallicola]|uniref:ABC transporter ATP-binding protein n=1 Tax=Sulfidibacter corallicola TaxID=2818388 RepID=A0A8A4TNX7_SULCO|nr:ABC transporter ATP-binding protein [Sulfidibacter corallicola]QTD51253.1 ABC transporter ATP-binding protein [Sulfidibacter corallicola]
MIRLEGVVKSYQNFVAVNGLTLHVPPGSVFGFLGPNGAGKTTTIRMLTGILEPDEGSLLVFGKTYRKNRNDILNRLGYVPDRPFLYGKLTAMELLRFLGSLRKIQGAEVQRRAMDLLDQFNLADFANQLIERYSHGMRQKLVLASALLHDPDLLIVDEPMVGLDPRAAKQVKELILQFARQGKSVFMSTHTLEVAAQLCHQVGIIHKGKLVADESIPNLTKRIEANDGDLEAVFMALTKDLERDQDREVVPF